MEKQEKVSKKVKSIADKTKEKTKIIGDKAKNSIEKTKNKAIETIDVNGDGNIDIEDVIILGLRTPGIKISREKFLRKEFGKKFEEEQINNAIEKNPSMAGIELSQIDKIADQVIKYERNCASGISAALGTAAVGPLMVASIPTELIQYYGYMLRATQKLMYLYGFPEINVEEKDGTFDSETMNVLIVCLGVMFGVSGANKALKVLAVGLKEGAKKKIVNAHLTKGVVFPIVKKIANWFNVTLTKELFGKAVTNPIPVIGAIIGGGITFFSFKPCCDKLKKTLRNTIFSNPNYIKDNENAFEADAEIIKESN